MTIYIDIVILENLIMNYIILLATGIVTKNKIINTRLIIASLIGAIYSAIAYIRILKIYSNILMKILLSIIIIYIAFNPQKADKLLKDTLFFYLISFAFGGAAYAFIYIIKPQEILTKNGMFLGIYPLKTIMLGGIIAFILIIVTYKILKSKFDSKKLIYPIKIFIEKNVIKTKAFVDTGNMLKEPITGIPVIIVERVLLYNYLPKQILDHLDEIIGGDFAGIPIDIQNKYISKLKLIPFKSLGKENGMLLGIKIDKVEIIKEDEINEKNNIIIGIYKKSLTKNGEYQALVGSEFW